MTIHKILLAISATTLLAGCAGKHFVSSQPFKSSGGVRVTTLPAGATVTSEFGDSCVSPCTIALLSETGGEITVSLDGYQTERERITSSVSEARIARQATDNAIEAIDPDPVSIGLTALATLVDGKGSVMNLDKHDVHFDLVALAEGEVDLLADDEPLTGERIPIDLSEPEAETKVAAAQ